MFILDHFNINKKKGYSLFQVCIDYPFKFFRLNRINRAVVNIYCRMKFSPDNFRIIARDILICNLFVFIILDDYLTRVNFLATGSSHLSALAVLILEKLHSTIVQDFVR